VLPERERRDVAGGGHNPSVFFGAARSLHVLVKLPSAITLVLAWLFVRRLPGRDTVRCHAGPGEKTLIGVSYALHQRIPY